MTRTLPGLALAAVLAVGGASIHEQEELAPTAPAPAPGPAWTLDPGALPPEVAEAARASRALPVGDRMGAVSAPFVGRSYQDGCTGEGEGYDPDPPARYDVFDCLTFLEEVLALALAPDPAWVGWYRRHLRYRDGVSSYEARRHFFEAEWVPENIANGFLVDITESLGEATWVDREVSLRSWQHWRRRPLFALPDARLPVGRLRIPVLPLDQALAAVERIPTGAIIVTVRIPVAHLPIMVTHVGFTVPAAVPTMRHATHMSSQRVRDDRLSWYFTHLKEYVRWPVAGVNVLMPREQGPRLGALAGSAPGGP